jgi:hypothetical protein
VSYWRLCAPEGVRFGHRVWVDIQVSNDAAPISLVQPEPAPIQPSVDLSPITLTTPTDQLELEFEHMTMSVPPQQQEPMIPEHVVPLVVSQPVVFEPVPVVLPVVPEPVQPTQPAQPEPTDTWGYMSPQEAESIQTLRDMGFNGDLLTILRRNK